MEVLRRIDTRQAVARNGGRPAPRRVLSCRVTFQQGQLTPGDVMEPREARQENRFEIEKLEERIAPSNANFPPGQFPSGNPAHAPGKSNPNVLAWPVRGS